MLTSRVGNRASSGVVVRAAHVRNYLTMGQAHSASSAHSALSVCRMCQASSASAAFTAASMSASLPSHGSSAMSTHARDALALRASALPQQCMATALL